jgi:hypothetical protein
MMEEITHTVQLRCYNDIAKDIDNYFGREVTVWYNNVEIIIGIITSYTHRHPDLNDVYKFTTIVEIGIIEILLKNEYPNINSDYDNLINWINSLSGEGAISKLETI